MIKSLNKNDTLNTPYTTTRGWHFSNNLNEDLVLYEHTGSDGTDIAVAIEFIDYGNGSDYPSLNSSCSLALEQQESNIIRYREGKKIEGLFYPDADPTNLDGTYKRLVYQQVQGMFYNNYRDPTKMWGMEEIDFDKSQVKKFLQDKFVMFTIPPRYMGEKIVPTSVMFIDHAGDNEYRITDDGKTNLNIGTNVFSREQELGNFPNKFASGSDGTCNVYFDFDPPNGLINLTASQVGGYAIAQLDWFYDSNDALGYNFERSEDSGSTWTYAFSVYGGNLSQSFDNTVLYRHMYWYRTCAYNLYGSSSWSNTASVYIVGLRISNPHDTAGDISSSVSFSVSASGLAPIYYQWESGSTFLSDTARITGSYTSSVTTAVLNINELHLSDSGSYRVYVWNAYDGLTSSYADLHVNLYPPSIIIPPDDITVDLSEGPMMITHPSDQIGYPGFTATFTVSASSPDPIEHPISYFWLSGSTFLTDDGTHITGSRSASLSIINVVDTDTGSYRALATNIVGYVYSNTASLTIVYDSPLIISHPQDVSTFFGGTASFFASASGTQPLTWQWYSGSTALTDGVWTTGSYQVGGYSSSLRINNIVIGNTGSYRVNVSNIAGNIYSNYANLTIYNAWGEDWESYPEGPIATSSNNTIAFGANGTIRPANKTIVAVENVNDYAGSPTLDSGTGWAGPGVIN